MLTLKTFLDRLDTTTDIFRSATDILHAESLQVGELQPGYAELYQSLHDYSFFIEKNFSDSINLESIAAKAHVSKFHFIRLFKKYYGRTPNQYLQEVRIENAKKLFKKGKTTDLVCTSVGFTSKTSFISLFKKLTATTPSSWQNKRAILKNK